MLQKSRSVVVEKLKEDRPHLRDYPPKPPVLCCMHLTLCVGGVFQIAHGRLSMRQSASRYTSSRNFSKQDSFDAEEQCGLNSSTNVSILSCKL